MILRMSSHSEWQPRVCRLASDWLEFSRIPFGKDGGHKAPSRQFDPEVFAEFMHAILDALSSAPASQFAAGARSLIVESLRSSNDRVATKINRTAAPAIMELWDTIPAATRTQMETNLRASASLKKRSAIGFLKHLVVLLKQHREKIGRGRHLGS